MCIDYVEVDVRRVLKERCRKGRLKNRHAALQPFPSGRAASRIECVIPTRRLRDFPQQLLLLHAKSTNLKRLPRGTVIALREVKKI